MPVRRLNITEAGWEARGRWESDDQGSMVQMAVKIVIEPIFEADFEGNSYGFRPKRNAHQAMDDISLHLRMGKTQVIDARHLEVLRYHPSRQTIRR